MLVEIKKSYQPFGDDIDIFATISKVIKKFQLHRIGLKLNRIRTPTILTMKILKHRKIREKNETRFCAPLFNTDFIKSLCIFTNLHRVIFSVGLLTDSQACIFNGLSGDLCIFQGQPLVVCDYL